ncbi:MAG: hypothetical protein G01um10147_609 [Microgenomates group bacterium Gr01-1014_7]|nr:MAG: hypothetical protein G01um10147_609 [Microgenomates group bacterium Gr01-1014_7]
MSRQGLTLLEVLVAMGIAVIIGTLLVSVMINSAGLFYKQSSTLQEGLNINDTLGKVREAVKQSSGVAATSSATQIVLKVPAINSSGNIITDTFDYIIFFQDQTKLRYKFFPDVISSRKSQDQIFSVSVDSLTFKYLDSQNPPNEVSPASATKVRIILSLKQKTGQNIEVNTATSEASLRND